MKSGIAHIVAAALLTAAAAGCASGPPTHCELTEKDDGRRLRLIAGDTLTVDLAGNPTTGYRWQVAEPESPEVLKATDDEFVAPTADRCGAPGRQRLSFTAAAPGETTLRLVYVRPWEKGAAPVRSFRAELSVSRR